MSGGSMSGGDDRARLPAHDEFTELAVGQALHALEPDDEQRLAAHLLGCADCARTVVDAAALGAAMATIIPAEAPPAGLRARLLAAAAAEPRLSAPRTRTQAPVRPQGPVRPQAPDTWTPSGSTSGRPGSSADAAPPRMWRRPRVLALTAVAAAVIGAAVAVPTTLSLSGSGTGVTQSALARAMAAPGARTVALTGGGGATGHAIVSSQGLYLLVDDLPHNDTASSTYVLWSIPASGERTSVATFDVSGKDPVVLARSGDQGVPPDAALAVSYEKGRTAPSQPSDVMLQSRA